MINSQIFLHKGKKVDPVKSLVDQGIVSGANIFILSKAKGGGGNNSKAKIGKFDMQQ